MNDIFKLHMQRMRAGASQATAITELSRWITDNTFIGGSPYSYRDHEYQKKILDCDAREIVARKCSQVGLTEMSVRKALALCGMIKNFTTIYTLPTAHFAATLSKTRVNPIINESPYLKELTSELDNVEVKQLGGSFLYLKGAASSNAPISIPADCLVHDEIDFSDPVVISQYQSRLTHSKYKFKMILSTPTIPGKGVDEKFQASKRHFNFVKCSCCGFSFIPDYYEHVRVPGFNEDLRAITKRNLHKIEYQSAFVECPACGGRPSLAPAHREWVCENEGDNHVAYGFQVSPFDAPAAVSCGDLIEASTRYVNNADFINFSLGLPFFSQESVLSPEEIRATLTPCKFEGGFYTVMGIDLGMVCHVVVANTSFDGSMQIVHIEKVPMQRLRERYTDLRLKHKVRLSVIDSMPYTDLVLGLQAIDVNLYASVFSQIKGTELFTVRKREEEETKGLQQLRQINVNRDKTLDSLMGFIRSGQFSKVTCPDDDEFVQHCTDMRRVKDWDLRTQEIKFRWVKSEAGDDHFFFATAYAFLAKHIIGTASGSMAPLPLVYSFKVTNNYGT